MVFIGGISAVGIALFTVVALNWEHIWPWLAAAAALPLLATARGAAAHCPGAFHK